MDLPEWLASINREPKTGNREPNMPIIGTLLEGEDMYQVLREPRTDNREPKILVMGNEGNGLSEEVRKLVTHKIRIPSYPKNVETSESLNVSIATGIILAYLRHM